MISETITLPKTISEAEDRFVVKLKDNLLRMIKEINRNSKKIEAISNEEEEVHDYTDEFNSKANVNASNIGYGEEFIEGEDYDAEDNRIEWGRALTNSENVIAEDNETLVSSQNVYDETHPYMEKDGNGNYINPYHFINYKNLINHEGAVDINKQDRWSEQNFFQPHEPNDNMVKENLIALDTVLYNVTRVVEELDYIKANIDLGNLTMKDPESTGQDNVIYGQTRLMNSTTVISGNENIFVTTRDVYVPEIQQWTRVFVIDADYEPSSPPDLSGKANVDASNVGDNFNGSSSAKFNNKAQWGSALGLDTQDISSNYLSNSQLGCLVPWNALDTLLDSSPQSGDIRYIDTAVTLPSLNVGLQLMQIDNVLQSVYYEVFGYYYGDDDPSSIGGIPGQLDYLQTDIGDAYTLAYGADNKADANASSISDLQDDLSDLSSEVSTISNNLYDVMGDVADLLRDISRIDNAISSLDSRVTALGG